MPILRKFWVMTRPLKEYGRPSGSSAHPLPLAQIVRSAVSVHELRLEVSYLRDQEHLELRDAVNQSSNTISHLHIENSLAIRYLGDLLKVRRNDGSFVHLTHLNRLHAGPWYRDAEFIEVEEQKLATAARRLKNVCREREVQVFLPHRYRVDENFQSEPD
ncbi:hypothetical protein ACM66B_002293 [Microbotryomycetes sp. NB124-2]